MTIDALPGQLLGFTLGKSITIDPTAAGWGWSVMYPDGSAPRMDLLFTVMHELGLALGFVEDDPAQPVVMGRTLAAEIGPHVTPRLRPMPATTALMFQDLPARHEGSGSIRLSESGWITSYAGLAWISSGRPTRVLEQRSAYRAMVVKNRPNGNACDQAACRSTAILDQSLTFSSGERSLDPTGAAPCPGSRSFKRRGRDLNPRRA